MTDNFDIQDVRAASFGAVVLHPSLSAGSDVSPAGAREADYRLTGKRN